MKKSAIAIAVLAGIPVVWSAGWFTGREFIVKAEADKAVEQLRSGAIFFNWEQREISGFPFAYDIAYRNVSLSDSKRFTTWSADQVTVTAGLEDTGAILLTPSDQSRLVVNAETPVTLGIESEALQIRLSRENDVVVSEISARDIRSSLAEPSGALREFSVAAEDLDLRVDTVEGDLTQKFEFTIAKLNTSHTSSEDQVELEQSSTEIHGAKGSGEYRADGGGAFTLNENTALNAVFSSAGATAGGGQSGRLNLPDVSYSYKSGASSSGFRQEGRDISVSSKIDALSLSLTSNDPVLDGVAGELAEVSFAVSGPFLPAEDAAPWSLTADISELTGNERLWSLIDPAAALPRNAASLALILGGDVRVTTPLIGDDAGQNRLIQEPPLKIETLQIRQASLNALGAGAEVTGELRLVPIPQLPTGQLHVELRGAMVLLNQLAAAGLIPQQQALMIGALAPQLMRRGDGPDHLIADIDVENGSVTVNGNRL